MPEGNTTAAVQGYLDALAGDSPADPIVRALVERLLKATREVRPRTVREFFALVNRHIRWELNDLARRLDEQPDAVELDEGQAPAPASSHSVLTPDGRRMLAAIE